MSIFNPSDSDSATSSLITGAALTGSLPALGYLSHKSDQYNISNKLASFAGKLAGSDYLNDQMERTLVSTTNNQVLSSSEQSLRKILLSQFMALEEMSPLHVLRTLQISNFLQPFSPLSSNNQAIHLSANSIRNQQHFYESLINYVNGEELRKIKRKLEVRDLTRGMFFKNNTIYGADKSGNIDLNDIVVKNARLTLGSIKNGEIYSNNHILDKFANSIGSSLNKEGVKATPLMFVAGKDNLDFSKKWMNSTLRFSMDVGFKTLDNPLAGFEEMLHGVGAGHTGIFQTKTWMKAKEFSGKLQLGTNGNYDLGIMDSLKVSGKNLAIKGGGLAVGLSVADQVVRAVSTSNSTFSEGITTGLTNLYASARVGVAEIWSDRFQGYKEKQEQAAPGSTNLTTLLAFPLSGALLGAQLSYFNRVGTASIAGIEKASSIYNVEAESKLLKDSVGIDTKLKPMKRNALIGGLVGGALILPFLPGALIGESSESLKQKYSGEKEEAEKANRFWMFGGTPWEGSHTKFHTQNWVARVKSDATDKVRYGDDATKSSMNPFLHPFSYLKDPYKFEKRNAESMPYPVWGMDVGYGSFFGKVFERTIGQVIKPDVINPAYKDALLTNADYGGTPTGGVSASDILHAKTSVGKSFVESSKSLFGLGENRKQQAISKKDASLISDGLMVPLATPGYDPLKESTSLSYKALMDFTGIKGWSTSLVVDGFGMEPNVDRIQLARSGEGASFNRDLLDQNVGDILGLGEFQRKILPTSSGALPERFNPIANNAASWLPSDKDKYFIDFKHGNMFDKVARGEERLPGVGLEALYPELKGMDVEKYPLVYKHKILSNVAKGSEEFINSRKQAIEAYKQGKLSEREIEILGTTLDQEVERDTKKTFHEVPSKFRGPLGSIHNALWETMRTNAESPLEMLTPIRPAAKFLHQRTAIEDYVETQLGGSDTAIWTNPYSHFLKPAINKARQSAELSGNFIPKELKEKYNIDEYFDKFKYIKARRQHNDLQADSTVIGAGLSGLNTKDKVLKFKRGLQTEQKDYFDSFSKETNEGKRNQIRAIVSDDVRRGYEQIWQNTDIANKARKSGGSVQKAIAENLHDQTNKLKKAYDVDLTKADKIAARKQVLNNNDSYSDLGFSNSDRVRFTEDEQLRRKMADKEALTYLGSRGGVPNNNFIGWDPRLSADDIKIRTLSIGGQDLKRFGFWKKDEERMARLSAITNNTSQVFSDLDVIKTEMQSDRRLKRSIEQTMFGNGFKVSKIDLVDSNYNSILVREE